MPQNQLTLHMQRVVDAPRRAVFSACTDPAQLGQWWGPRGFTAPAIDIDLRAGGAYRIAMQPPEGELFHLAGQFREVVVPSRLVYTFGWEPPDPEDVETVVTLVLEDLAGQTGLHLTQEAFASERRRALHEAGWSDSLDRLQEFLSAPMESRIR
jgi:uncharacterized protein YndB with AHSA1/START domain